MGLHPSLKKANKLGGRRTVLKRNERIKWLIAKGQWKEGDKVLGLPKIKIIKLKTVKKEKVKEEPKPEEGEVKPAAKPTNETK
ncbi:MAG: small basic protein [Candidatus Omnitrophica bacterium]|jgi:small basic protein (TIGR04137 family)|nr:small basic protein [Candidatus Omnitrophota bacterium]